MNRTILYPAASTLLRKGMMWAVNKKLFVEKKNHLSQGKSTQQKGTTMGTQNDGTMLRQIALLLIQADKFVKEGNFTAAMEKITTARTQDPDHLYAIAYEERVKALMQSRNKIETANACIPQDARQESVTVHSNGHPVKTDISERKIHSDTALQTDDGGLHAREKTIAALLAQTYHCFLRKEYNKALDEVARVYLVAPSHERARALEVSIRNAIQHQNGFAPGPNMKPHDESRMDTLRENHAHEELRRKAVAQKVNEIIERILVFIDAKQYDRGLDEITRGYILDPGNQQLIALERKIRGAQENNHVNHRLVNPQNGNSPVGIECDIEYGKSAKVSKCLLRVNELLRKNRMEEALNELAVAVVIDPFNEKVITLERTIIDAQHRQLEERRKRCEEIATMIG